MAILIGNDPAGSAIVPMLEREGLRVEITHSPEQAIERLREIVHQRPGGIAPEMAIPFGLTETGDGHGPEEGEAPDPYTAGPGGVGLDRRLAAVQERARLLDGEEQKIITEALAQADGNKTAAARLLGISRYALQRRLRRFAKPQNPS